MSAHNEQQANVINELESVDDKLILLMENEFDGESLPLHNAMVQLRGAIKLLALRASPETGWQQAQQAIRAACGMCDGHGYTIGTGIESGHDCDGTDAMCSQRCPVPIPVEVQEPCEYCGRPIAAIQALIDAAPRPQEAE